MRKEECCVVLCWSEADDAGDHDDEDKGCCRHATHEATHLFPVVLLDLICLLKFDFSMLKVVLRLFQVHLYVLKHFSLGLD